MSVLALNNCHARSTPQDTTEQSLVKRVRFSAKGRRGSTSVLLICWRPCRHAERATRPTWGIRPAPPKAEVADAAQVWVPAATANQGRTLL